MNIATNICALKKLRFLRNTINLNKTDVIYIKDNNRIWQSQNYEFQLILKNGDVHRRRL